MKIQTIVAIIIVVIVIAITVLLSQQVEVPSELLIALSGLVSLIVGLAGQNPFSKSGENNDNSTSIN